MRLKLLTLDIWSIFLFEEEKIIYIRYLTQINWIRYQLQIVGVIYLIQVIAIKYSMKIIIIIFCMHIKWNRYWKQIICIEY